MIRRQGIICINALICHNLHSVRRDDAGHSVLLTNLLDLHQCKHNFSKLIKILNIQNLANVRFTFSFFALFFFTGSCNCFFLSNKFKSTRSSLKSKTHSSA